MSKKTLKDFEQQHGGSRIQTLEKALEQAAGKRQDLVVDVPDERNTIQFAVVGDTHFGNIYEATDEWRAFLGRLHCEGVNTVLHCGDVLDGHRVYRGHEYEVHALGFAEQRKHFLESFATPPGMKFFFITGNHDTSFKNLAGVDIGNSLAEARPQWTFLHEDYGDVTLRTANGRQYRVRLVHPDGGTSYAISYRAQKHAESLDGGNKPNMLCMGHYHKAEHLPHYRNIDVIQAGCWQWQTPFMARKGSPAHVGGWIVRVTVGDDKSRSNSVRAEFVAYYREGKS